MAAENRDIDRMMFADGELDGDDKRSVADEVERDPEARGVVAGVEELGQLLRGHLEMAADDAAERGDFDDMWGKIEQRIHSNGAHERASAPLGQKAQPGGIVEGVRSFWDSLTSHLLTGAVAAAAVLLVIVVWRPFERVVEREVRVEVPQAPVNGVPVVLESQPPQVETLEVYEGSGTILTIEGEGDDSSTAVIWITDEDTVEGPI